MLESQLKRIGFFGSDDLITAYPFFDANFKICEYIFCIFIAIHLLQLYDILTIRVNLVTFLVSVWANHGDEISIQYSGTPALKGDFVR